MNNYQFGIVSTTLFFLGISLYALPVSLGTITLGLESIEGYQEGMAFISTDEKGEGLEILVAYKGFGLDEISWQFSGEGLTALQEATAKASWWRSQLLAVEVKQSVIEDISTVKPTTLYRFRNVNYPFPDTENTLRFIRQGKDYGLMLLETSPGVETRSNGNKTLPIFTLHCSGDQLPVLRNMLINANIERVVGDYIAQKAAIDAILESSPN